MIKVLSLSNIEEVSAYMDEQVYQYLGEAQIETMETFDKFDFIAFDWYDIFTENVLTEKILLYFDVEDLFIFAESDRALSLAEAMIKDMKIENPDQADSGQVMYRFFMRLLKNDMNHLEEVETEITDVEEVILSKKGHSSDGQIIAYRKELLRLKKYYEQLDFIFDELVLNDNGLLSDEMVRRFVIMGNRTERLISDVLNIREYVAQVREEQQSLINSDQNGLMKLFTLITAIFLPLTLMVGWYGMNFEHMPELSQPLGYPIFVMACVMIVMLLVLFFRKKRWF